MDIPFLLVMSKNKLNFLLGEKNLAYSSGDLERFNSLEAEIFIVENTISQLESLLN